MQNGQLFRARSMVIIASWTIRNFFAFITFIAYDEESTNNGMHTKSSIIRAWPLQSVTTRPARSSMEN